MHPFVKGLSIVVGLAAVLLGGYWKFVSSVTNTTSLKKGAIREQNLNIEKNSSSEENMAGSKSIYDYTYVDIDGQEQSMAKYRGHVLIVVNVASKCGYTCVNYQQLTELYDKYSTSEGLRILAFPCNQFGGQEPLGEAEIKEFVKEYKVAYDMASKVSVNGDKVDPLWTFLKDKQRGILGTTLVKWNFTKFLVDKNGNVLHRYAPNTNPKAMENDIIEAFKS